MPPLARRHGTVLATQPGQETGDTLGWEVAIAAQLELFKKV